MPALAAWILGGLLSIAASLAGRVLIALGFGAITYTGISVTLTWLKTQAVSSFSGLGADALGLLAYMKVGESISIIFSALLVRATLAGLSEGGSISRLVKR
jgi:hypothetical protein